MSLRNITPVQGFTPLAVGNCVLWCRGDFGARRQSTLADPAVDGGPVGGWLDRSGADNTLKALDANRPTLVYAGVNNRESIIFDGADDAMTNTLTMPQYDSTYFFVLRPGDASTNYFVFTDATMGVQLKLNATAGGAITVDWGGGDVGTAGGAFGAGEKMIIAVDCNSSSVVDVYKNSTLVASGAGSNIPDQMRIGSNTDPSRWYSGYIAEIAMYNVSLSSTNRDAVIRYLAYRYGIT